MIDEYAKKKNKEAAISTVTKRLQVKKQFGINSGKEEAFGIRKTVAAGSAGEKDSREQKTENAQIRTETKIHSQQQRESVKMSNIIAPKMRMKEVIRSMRIKEMLQSDNMDQLVENAGKVGINAITGTLRHIVTGVIKGCVLVAKKILALIGPVYAAFFLFAILIVCICADVSSTKSKAEAPETGKVNGVRVDMQGIETNAWYTTKNPFHQSGYGMVPRKNSGKGNCTCYAWGRRAEMTGEAPLLSTGNASAWYDYNIRNRIYKYGNVPKPGAICCWRGGSDGSGHVAVVEIVNADGSFTISESSWTRFFFRIREGKTVGNMNEGNLVFQGFIYIDKYE